MRTSGMTARTALSGETSPITEHDMRHNVCREERAKIVDGSLEIGGDRFHLKGRNDGRL